jgi:hypothetical protein
MTHSATKAHIPTSLQRRIDALPATDMNGLEVIEGFGIFIDTHRDQPHVGTFNEDIHRGMCNPMLVDYVRKDDFLRNPQDGMLLQRHDKHLFIEPEEWGAFLVDWMMTRGSTPFDGTGSLPTSHFRDSRKKLYLLRSFRQMVAYNERKPT